MQHLCEWCTTNGKFLFKRHNMARVSSCAGVDWTKHLTVCLPLSSLSLSPLPVFHYQVKMHFFSAAQQSFTEQPMKISLYGTHGEKENIAFVLYVSREKTESTQTCAWWQHEKVYTKWRPQQHLGHRRHTHASTNIPWMPLLLPYSSSPGGLADIWTSALPFTLQPSPDH